MVLLGLEETRAKLGLEEMSGSVPKEAIVDSGLHGTTLTTARADVMEKKAEAARADVKEKADDATGVGRADVVVTSAVDADADVPKADVSPNGDGKLNVGVTERVSVWDRLNPKITGDGKKSFAAIVGCVPQPELEFFPVEKEKDSRVRIPMTMAKGMAHEFSTVLLGYFLGPRIPFTSVLRAVKNAWGPFGFRDAMVNDLGYFFFRFNDQGGCMHVADSSPLMINGVPLFVTQWDPSKGLF